MHCDYARTVFLYCYDNLKKPSPVKDSSEYPRYFYYECGIKDISSFHMSLIEENYFEQSPKEIQLNMLTVSELKNMLLNLNQPTKGKKADLIERILSNSNIFSQKFLSSPYYIISKKGKRFLEEHDDYIKVYQHSRNWGISPEEFDKYKKPEYSFYDVAQAIFNERLKTDNCFGRNQYFHMYQLKEEHGNHIEAFKLLLRTIYIDVNGVDFSSLLECYKNNIFTKNETKKELIDICKANISLAPGVVNNLKYYADCYDESYIDDLYNWRLPVQICSKPLFKSIIKDGINDVLNFQLYDSKLKKAYCRVIDDLIN